MSGDGIDYGGMEPEGLGCLPSLAHPVTSFQPPGPCLLDIPEASLLFPTHTATSLAPPGLRGCNTLHLISLLPSRHSGLFVLPGSKVVYPKS